MKILSCLNINSVSAACTSDVFMLSRVILTFYSIDAELYQRAHFT